MPISDSFSEFNTVVHEDIFLTNTGGSEEQGVNGSGTAVLFDAGPPAGQIWYVYKITFLLIDPGSPDVGDYGNIGGGLTNGVLSGWIINGSTYNLQTVTNNENLMLTWSESPRAVAGSNTFLDTSDYYFGAKIFDTAPVQLTGDTNDVFGMLIQDNLTGIQIQKACMHYWRRI